MEAVVMVLTCVVCFCGGVVFERLRSRAVDERRKP